MTSSRIALLLPLALALGAAGPVAGCSCDNSGKGTDTGTDATDTGTDATGPGTDATGPGTDATGPGTDATGPGTDAGGSGLPCTTDASCTAGAEWCAGGVCVACDNLGLLCDIKCAGGWTTYERNGCFPCACAPANACTGDGDCAGAGGAGTCYAGAFCWDWCPAGDPSCCFGNQCGLAGCPPPNPVGCFTRGCPVGEECVPAGCEPSTCDCTRGGWICTDDCGGGSCL